MKTRRVQLNCDMESIVPGPESSKVSVPSKPSRRGKRKKTNKNLLLYATLMFSLLLCCVYLFTRIDDVEKQPLYAVKIGDEIVAYTDETDLPQEILSQLAEEEALSCGVQVFPHQLVTVAAVDPGEEMKICTPEEISEIIKGHVSFLGKGYVIRVENTDIVALSSEEEARAVISDLRTNYINSIVQSGMVTVEEIFIKENIEIVEKDVPVSIFRNKEEAVQLLTRGTDKTLNYVVRRGDCLWTIAQDNKMTVDDLRKANPEVKGDFLLEGQNLNLILPDPYVTIESKELVVYTVNIPYSLEVVEDPDMWPWEEKVLQYGQNGIKEITDQVIKENGKEISRIRVNEKIQKYPVTKRISRGTKQVPQMGSGDMVWPVQGQVTSYFGMRWGSMHNGIDIAANRGTPVLAADSGMVSFAGWNGGYGYLVKIDHGGGKETRYAHLSVPPVSVGQKVEKGDVIGYVDSTGNSSGPHLHFEVRANGVAKNPLDFYQ